MPRDQFAEVFANDISSTAVDGRRVRWAYHVSGDNLLIRKGEDVTQFLPLSRFLDGLKNFLVGSFLVETQVEINEGNDVVGHAECNTAEQGKLSKSNQRKVINLPYLPLEVRK